MVKIYFHTQKTSYTINFKSFAINFQYYGNRWLRSSISSHGKQLESRRNHEKPKQQQNSGMGLMMLKENDISVGYDDKPLIWCHIEVYLEPFCQQLYLLILSKSHFRLGKYGRKQALRLLTHFSWNGISLTWIRLGVRHKGSWLWYSTAGVFRKRFLVKLSARNMIQFSWRLCDFLVKYIVIWKCEWCIWQAIEHKC